MNRMLSLWWVVVALGCGTPPGGSRDAGPGGDGGLVADAGDDAGTPTAVNDGGADGGVDGGAGTRDGGSRQPDAGPFDGCPPRALTFGPDVWGRGRVLTSDVGEFSDNVASFRFVPRSVPSGQEATASTTLTFVEYIGPPTSRDAVLSTRPCDFSLDHAVRDPMGAAAMSFGTTGPGFIVRLAPGRFGVVLTPGTPYYINVRNQGCTTDCIMQGTFRGW